MTNLALRGAQAPFEFADIGASRRPPDRGERVRHGARVAGLRQRDPQMRIVV